MSTRADIVAEARSWRKTPFHHQGRVRGVGTDCIGVPLETGKTLGLLPADLVITGYPRQPDGTSLMAHCDRWLVRIPRAEMAPGDVIVVRFDRDPQHVGVLGDYRHGGLSMIHALGTPDGRGEVVEHRLDAGTLARLVAVYRFPGVD